MLRPAQGTRSLRQHSLVVAGLTEGSVTLLTSDFQALHVPAALLPDGLEVGSILHSSFALDCAAEASRVQQILQLLDEVSVALSRESARLSLPPVKPSAPKASWVSLSSSQISQDSAPSSPGIASHADSSLGSAAQSPVTGVPDCRSPAAVPSQPSAAFQ
ncbi:hypothetical protein TGPRC2_316235 [Toxoplasma gondii TgCatPRC2]|uniref:Uncharacterized protein n=14 Tax=Toxoplasma gondii TaxID=5811 RepID=A0A125YZ45_TOXGV|nr:hypothetical protein TGME49_316235 [Toxoplasma gondii ME49]ESS35280.1 hypothetical protein TGVEG_316235 [Toxoplasma gondii VEG]KFG36664.1 hypothetical protein TGDOM2_316235 [Toxoplasma gondii GAB2-2007-GAL-DOM2]KFG49293.1 hypothetical protein TGP89_316235 [Toxoplasma gondii p89]KFG56441.1 hypothetical protein TGFOU_316235 [Toxoplasma gondii FOU]KFG66427.1 hypothetical protein TGRUB_316235 [Toxoplasma gondii RUB]KFH01948.1 hypothetical protein TGVAND_316235 [Toxoplasma gondii VAND]KFH18208|eukprot:XP_018635295.1 hypothetical protein TGME49_316235 [Toxoplasma gondii ME49]